MRRHITLIALLAVTACSSSAEPPDRTEVWDGRCTAGTDPVRCELAECLVVLDESAQFRVRVENRCDHPITYLPSYGVPWLEELPNMSSYWSLRDAETGEPINTSSQVQSSEYFPSATMPPGASLVLNLPGTKSGVYWCEVRPAPPIDLLVTASIVLVAPLPEGAAEIPPVATCHATSCDVETSDACVDLPNFIVFEDFLTFNRAELCRATNGGPDYCDYVD